MKVKKNKTYSMEVPNQLKILMPVGAAIIIVAVIK